MHAQRVGPDEGVDITDKISYTLLKKGIIDYETWRNPSGEGGEKKTRRNQGRFWSTTKVDHDIVFREVASVYAFREVYLADETIDEPRIDFIKVYVDKLQDRVRFGHPARVLP